MSESRIKLIDDCESEHECVRSIHTQYSSIAKTKMEGGEMMEGRRKIIMSLIMMLVLIVSSISGYCSSGREHQSRKIIVFREGTDDARKEEILIGHNAVKLKEVNAINAVVAYVRPGMTFSENDVEYVEDDLILSIAGKPTDNKSSKTQKDDTIVPDQPPETVPWGIEYMKNLVPAASGTGELVKVGIIDTGIDMDHPDLVGNIKGGYNTISKKGSYDDDNGHGTHVAGIIAAVDNDIGVVGVLPEAELYAVKALDSTGNGYVSDVIEGIEWCIENDIDIINMSIGMTNDSMALHEVVIRAWDVGIVLVAAAGNNYGGDCEYPAAYQEVIGVGAISYKNQIGDFSAISGVDFWAPGVNVYSTYLDGTYVSMDGTSMAAPHWILKAVEGIGVAN